MPLVAIDSMDTQRSSPTQRTIMVTDRSSQLVTETRHQRSAVQNMQRATSTLIGCLPGIWWLQGPGRGQGRDYCQT